MSIYVFTSPKLISLYSTSSFVLIILTIVCSISLFYLIFINSISIVSLFFISILENNYESNTLIFISFYLFTTLSNYLFLSLIVFKILFSVLHIFCMLNLYNSSSFSLTINNLKIHDLYDFHFIYIMNK